MSELNGQVLERVVRLEERFGGLKDDVTETKAEVHDVRQRVSEIHDLLLQGRGAMRLAYAIGGLVLFIGGAAVSGKLQAFLSWLGKIGN